MKMKTEKILITPKLARQYLVEMNTDNRPMSKQTVNKYAQSMQVGHWAFNGVPIIISDDDRLIDGQHRLAAIAQSGIPTECLVVRGVDFSAFATIDRGRSRRNADILSIAGKTNTKILSTCILAYHKTISASQKPVMTEELLLSLAEKKSIRHFTARFASNNPLRRFVPTVVSGVCAAMCELHGQEIADEFLEKLGNGLNVEATDPEYLLREKLISSKMGVRFTSEYLFGLVIKAANMKINNRTGKLLKYVQSVEDFPVLDGVKVAKK